MHRELSPESTLVDRGGMDPANSSDDVRDPSFGRTPLTRSGVLRAWLSSGLCQTASGAFVAWSDVASSTHSFEYPEISGYALTYFAGRPGLTSRERRAAVRCADWLVRRVRDGKLNARDGWDGDSVYAFDLGMIAHGLMVFGDCVGETSYVESGRRLGRLVAEHLLQHESLRALIPGMGKGSRRISWSTQGAAHLLKLSQCLLSLAERGCAEGLDAALRLLDRTSALQRSDGAFLTQEGAPIMLHPLLYAVEGLWVWSSARSDASALERGRRALEWAWQHQLPTGGFPRSAAEASSEQEQMDVTGQAIRAAFLLGIAPAGLDKSVARLREFVSESPPLTGIPYQPHSTHHNVWATLFAAQALELADDRRAGLTWKELV